MHDARVTQPVAPSPARASLVDLAYESLLEAIFDRQIEPGARLGIDVLADQLDMSITPVREALNRLTTQGLVTQAANRGFAVAPTLSTTEFHSLFAARRVIEVAASTAAVPSSARPTCPTRQCSWPGPCTTRTRQDVPGLRGLQPSGPRLPPGGRVHERQPVPARGVVRPQLPRCT
jgi:hypothetical protein